MAANAQLVFCPYSYILDPVVRGAMEVDITGSIIVLDEAQYVLFFFFHFCRVLHIAPKLFK